MRKLGRRLLGPVAALLLLFGTAAPAEAHAGLVLTVNDDGHGSLSVDITWVDGHPVSEAVAGTLTAVSAAGAQVGPAALTRLPGQPTAVYDGTLKPGTWQVTVDLALPGLGHCSAEVRVVASDAAATPGSTRCGETSAPALVVAARNTGRAEPPWPLFGTAGAIVVLSAAGVVVIRRRAAPARAGARRR